MKRGARRRRLINGASPGECEKKGVRPGKGRGGERLSRLRGSVGGRKGVISKLLRDTYREVPSKHK